MHFHQCKRDFVFEPDLTILFLHYRDLNRGECCDAFPLSQGSFLVTVNFCKKSIGDGNKDGAMQILYTYHHRLNHAAIKEVIFRVFSNVSMFLAEKNSQKSATANFH